MAIIDLSNSEPNNRISLNWRRQETPPSCYQLLIDENGRKVIRFLSFATNDFEMVNGQKQDMIFNISDLKSLLDSL
ncbi:MAG: hypothetical protein KKD31_07675 [Bacteroidetes bacterium]|nr:hypothetical protein [Bacteroidota bacterium]